MAAIRVTSVDSCSLTRRTCMSTRDFCAAVTTLRQLVFLCVTCRPTAWFTSCQHCRWTPSQTVSKHVCS